MSVVGYFNPNDTIHVSAIISDDNNITCNINELYTPQNQSTNQQCTDEIKNNIKNTLSENTVLSNKLKESTTKNNISQKLYYDSGIFYSTQYIQLWNMAGGIVVAGFMIYYLVKQKK